VLAGSAPFQIRGILNSEMLMFVTLADALGVRHIIESGRARGQSTEIIARFFAGTDTRFDSIEYNRDSPDARIAEARLKNLPVRLHYGDAFKLVPHLLSDSPVALLLDGPKGIDALRLAVSAMRNPCVRMVAFHDAHRGSQPMRGLIERYAKAVYASDDVTYCEHFADLDAACWAELQRHSSRRGWRPYWRGDRRMPSYGPTLVVIANDFGPTELDSFCRAVLRHDAPLRRTALKLWLRLPRALRESRLRTAILGRPTRDGYDS
jgi:hypothetical protein